MKKYFETVFAAIANLDTITASDIWTTNYYDFGDDEICWANKYGFDPVHPNKFLEDEYWGYSDDYRVRDKAEEKIMIQEQLVNKFRKDAREISLIINERAVCEHTLKNKPVHRFIEQCGKLLYEKRETKKVTVRIIGASKEWTCGYEATTLDLSKRFVLFVDDRLWAPDFIREQLLDIEIYKQCIYDVDGKHIVAVRSYEA